MADELHEAFLRLFTRCEPELRAFVRSCLPRLQDVDEVMQEVSLVAWRKFGDLDDRGRFAPWACLIARYEILKYRRTHARNRLLLDESVIEALADEAAAEMPLHQRRLEALEACFDKLAPARRGPIGRGHDRRHSQRRTGPLSIPHDDPAHRRTRRGQDHDDRLRTDVVREVRVYPGGMSATLALGSW
jgi:RNA polymerase sigma factor (sigma-70 family)